jgi:hypothetical protein
MPLNTVLVVAISGLAIFTPPPFRPVFFLATRLLSELFQITLVFFAFRLFEAVHLPAFIPGGSMGLYGIIGGSAFS